MAIQFYNPGNLPKQTTPEGHTGANSSIYLPFYSYGRWFPSGLQYTFLSAEIPQRTNRIMNGLTKPNTFRKDASSCPIAV